MILDVNSLYPSVMYYEKLPFGEPKYFKGKYENDNVYDLYIQRIVLTHFKVKKNKIPTIQIKNNSSFLATEYLRECNKEVVLTLTNIDLKLFLEQYEYDDNDLEYIDGWKFRSKKGIFKDYIDKWITRKNEATISKNSGQRQIAKLMLNSLYGKFATRLTAISKNPYLENDIVHYRLGNEKDKKGLYLPIGSFITAYARNKTIRTSQGIMDYSIEKYGVNKYIYSDTDSIHCLLSIEELKKFCEIDDVKLGAWKHEGSFTKARFVRQKCYIEEINRKVRNNVCRYAKAML